MAVKPKFYPILPRERRTKSRTYGVVNEARNQPTRYRQYMWYESTSKVNKTTSRFVLNDYSANVGPNTQVVIKLPSWRLLVAKGMDATNSYSREVCSITPTRYGVQSENSSYKNIGAGTTDGGRLTSIKDWSVLQDKALRSLKNRLNGNIGNAQLAAPLAESREIHRLVRQINTLGIDMLKAALAIKKTRGKSAAKFFGDVWLGFGFGVRPLIADLKSASNAILSYQTRIDNRIRVVGAASDMYSTGQVIGPLTTVAPGCKIGWHNRADHVMGVRIVAGIDLYIRSSASYGMTDHLGISLGAVPGALWELTPFSWVVDYGFTVGDWIDDMFFTVPGVLKYCSRSNKYQTETRGIPYHRFDPGYSGSFGGSECLTKYVSFTRSTLSSLPVRSLRVKTADEVAKHSLTKLLNLGSVLIQRR